MLFFVCSQLSDIKLNWSHQMEIVLLIFNYLTHAKPQSNFFSYFFWSPCDELLKQFKIWKVTKKDNRNSEIINMKQIQIRFKLSFFIK